MKIKPFRKLVDLYHEKGIALTYGRSSKRYYLSVINAPTVVKGVETERGSCQLTGWYNIYSKEELQDVEVVAKRVFKAYKETYKDNPIMLSYVQ